MSLTNTNKILHAWFETLFRTILEHPNTEEIAINRARSSNDRRATELWIKQRNTGQWHCYVSPLSTDDIELFMHILANVKGVRFGVHSPFLYETLPGGHRFSGVIGRNIRFDPEADGGVALCIRQEGMPRPTNVAPITGLEEIAIDRSSAATGYAELDRIYRPLADAMRTERKGVIIVGIPGAGKTTVLKKLLRTLDPTWRYMFAEDTREIPPWLPNSVFLYVPRTEPDGHARWRDLLNFLTRSTGDVLTLGEVSPVIAGQMENLINIGYQNCNITLHAPTASEALQRLYSLMREGGSNISWPRYKNLLTTTFAYVVVLERDPKTDARTCRSIETPSDVFARIDSATMPLFEEAAV